MRRSLNLIIPKKKHVNEEKKEKPPSYEKKVIDVEAQKAKKTISVYQIVK